MSYKIVLLLELCGLAMTAFGLEIRTSNSGRKPREAYEKDFGPSLGYRPPPPLVRRQISSRVKYDPTKWIFEPSMTIAGAIMFDRTPDLSLNECLDKCEKSFQNASSRWVCRSLTYDRKWKLCDLFAIDGNSSPFFLSEYRHRDYFKYLAAVPPADKDLKSESREHSNEMQEKEIETTTAPAKVQLVDAAVQHEELPIVTNDSNNMEVKVKALASKQTGDALVVETIDQGANTITTEVQSTEPTTEKSIVSTTSTTILVNKRPSLKFAILPISQSTTTEAAVGVTEEVNFSSSTIPPPSTTTSESTSSSSSTTDVAKDPFAGFSILPEGFVTEDPSDNVTAIEVEPTKSSEKITHEKSARKKISGVPTLVAEDNKVPVENKEIIACGETETPRFIVIKDVKRTNESDQIADLERDSAEGCVKACKVHGIECQSVTFAKGRCQLWASSLNHGLEGELSQQEESFYLEKICILNRIAVRNDKQIFEGVRNFILVGHVQEVTDARTLSQCHADCLRAPESFGFVCKSAMFYPSDNEQNCLLNSEDRHTRADSFVTEDASVEMLYVELGEEVAVEKPTRVQRYKNYDSPIQRESSQWTKWTKCEGSNTLRHRYLRCSDKKDIRKCPKQTIGCKQLRQIQINHLKQTAECRAVRDPAGNQKCPHGVRVINGARHYCLHPVDC
ncbi:hypothetical protein M3Y96_00777200 [Aphelenchoides besseyi]|nr:hypothetical protein M3Y96_00777200 [Aphelenchoides besseyi]